MIDFPAPPLAINGKSSNKSEVEVNLDLLNILNIAEDDSLIEIQFLLSLRWRDERLIFRNLKVSDHLNIVSHGDAKRIWYPEIVFFNTKDERVERVR